MIFARTFFFSGASSSSESLRIARFFDFDGDDGEPLRLRDFAADFAEPERERARDFERERDFERDPERERDRVTAEPLRLRDDLDPLRLRLRERRDAAEPERDRLPERLRLREPERERLEPDRDLREPLPDRLRELREPLRLRERDRLPLRDLERDFDAREPLRDLEREREPSLATEPFLQ